MAFQDPVERAKAELEELKRQLAPEEHPEGVEDTATSDPQTHTPDTSTPAEQPTIQTQAPADDPNAETWKSRFETLQGKYNAEIPRLHGQISQLQQEVNTLKHQAETSPRNDQQQEDDDAPYRSPYITDDMRKSREYKQIAKEFGEDYAEKHFGAAALAARTQVQPVAEQTAENARDRFHNDISRLSPEWVAKNADPAFVAWARDTFEPYSGKAIIDLLKEAYQSGDAGRVANIFNSYQPPPVSGQEKPPPPPKEDPTVMVAPSKRSSSAQAVVDDNKGNVWTAAEADRVIEDITSGRIKGKEADRLLADIKRASAEGRILAR